MSHDPMLKWHLDSLVELAESSQVCADPHFTGEKQHEVLLQFVVSMIGAINSTNPEHAYMLGCRLGLGEVPAFIAIFPEAA